MITGDGPSSFSNNRNKNYRLFSIRYVIIKDRMTHVFAIIGEDYEES